MISLARDAWAFLNSSLGRGILIAAGILLAFWWVDHRAREDERAKCQTAALESKIEALQRDITIARNAEIDASIRGVELEAKASTYQEEVRRIQDELDQARIAAEREPLDAAPQPAPAPVAEPVAPAPRPAARRCVLTVDGLRRLQRIGPRPAGAQPAAAPDVVGKSGGAAPGR